MTIVSCFGASENATLARKLGLFLGGGGVTKNREYKLEVRNSTLSEGVANYFIILFI